MNLPQEEKLPHIQGHAFHLRKDDENLYPTDKQTGKKASEYCIVIQF